MALVMQSQTSVRSPGTKNNHITKLLLRYSKNIEKSPAFPSLFAGRAAAPSNHGAAVPQRHGQAASCWTCAFAVVGLLAWGVKIKMVEK